MGRFLKGAGRWLAYLLFFAAALVFFVYMTLPLDKAKDFLVRKAADEHHVALDITQLKVVGLAGVQLEGVTVTPQPTAEEREAFAKARDARKAWREAKKAAGAAKADAEDGAEGEDAAADAGKGAAKVAKGKTAKGKKGAKGKTAKGKKASKAKKDQPPPLPDGPMPIFVERMTAKVNPFALMKGTIDGDFEAALLGGTVTAAVTKNAADLKVKAELDGLAIDQITTLAKKLGLPVAGAIEGELDVEVPLDTEKGAPKFSKTTGHLDLKVINALMGPGQIASEAMGLLDVPRVRIAELGGRIAFGSRKGSFENFVIAGKDVEGDVQGYIQLADDLKRWGPRAHIQFKFSQAFLKKNKAVNTALTGFPKVRRATDREGRTGVQLSGTFGNLKPSLRKTSPYRKAKRTSRAKPAKGTTKAKRGKKARTTRKRSGVAKGNSKAKPRAKRGRKKTAAAARPTLKKGKPLVAANSDDEDEEDEDEEEEDEEPEEAEEPEESDEKKDSEEGEDDEKKDAEDGEEKDAEDGD